MPNWSSQDELIIDEGIFVKFMRTLLLAQEEKCLSNLMLAQMPASVYMRTLLDVQAEKCLILRMVQMGVVHLPPVRLGCPHRR